MARDRWEWGSFLFSCEYFFFFFFLFIFFFFFFLGGGGIIASFRLLLFFFSTNICSHKCRTRKLFCRCKADSAAAKLLSPVLPPKGQLLLLQHARLAQLQIYLS